MFQLIYIFMLLELDQLYVYDHAMLSLSTVDTLKFKHVFPHKFMTTLSSTSIPFPTGLKGQGVASPQVFLVSSFDLHLYEFRALQDTMERELPSHKRDVLILALPNICKSAINKKKEVFRSQIWHYALLSATVAAVPIPGMSIMVDVGILVKVLQGYLFGFGLDKMSLEKCSSATNTPLDELRAMLNCICSGKDVTKEFVLLMLKSTTVALIGLAAEEGSRWIPFIGIPIAAALSFTTIYTFLSSILNKLSVDAENIVTKALGIK